MAIPVKSADESYIVSADGSRIVVSGALATRQWRIYRFDFKPREEEKA